MTGFCDNLAANGVGPITMWDFHGAAFSISSITLVLWARDKYSATTGFYSDTQQIIFPVHFKILCFLGFTTFFQGMLLPLQRLFLGSSNLDLLVVTLGNSLSFGLSHFVIEGTLVLLWSNGIGHKSISRATMVGAASGCFVGVTTYIANSPHALFEIEDRQLIFTLIWEAVLLVVNGLSWVAPNHGRFARRPAVIYWARFWALFRVFIMVSQILMAVGVDAGNCLYHTTVFTGFGVAKLWVAHRTFVLEALWWHGAERQDSWTVSDIKRELSSVWENITRTSSAPTKPRVSVDVESNRVELTAGIKQPFDCMELSAQSAEAMTTAIGRITSTGQTGFKKVPLLDFSRVKILPNKTLGQGSSARVYKGKWCERDCAVKVLFTVEITSDEIQRTADEASILFTLQAYSQHIVGIFGVAVLPPSLCVVLEVCSEGSLGDVLYAKKEQLQRSRASRGAEGDGGVEGRFSLSRGAADVPRYDHVYALPWATCLELALGACRGVAALADALPGHSHNDLKSANFLVHCPEKDARVAGAAKAAKSSLAQFGFKYVVKLADVEFASKGVTPEYMRLGGTPNWTAPEILSGAAEVSPASDAFALACVLFEIATRGIPFDGTGAAVIVQQVKEGRRPAFPEPDAALQSAATSAAKGDDFTALLAASEVTSRVQFRSLVEKAWAQDPTARPSAADIVNELTTMRNEFVRIEHEAKEERRRGSLSLYKAIAMTQELTKQEQSAFSLS